MLYFIMAQGLSKFSIQVCAENKDLGLKWMMRKLGNSLEVLNSYIISTKKF